MHKVTFRASDTELCEGSYCCFLLHSLGLLILGGKGQEEKREVEGC